MRDIAISMGTIYIGTQFIWHNLYGDRQRSLPSGAGNRGLSLIAVLIAL